ncbi:MAG: rhodanese-like domain-containing protein [Gammaproteobacteria bacterium]|nr:rhodanese-like domain-containing protein [Gammaproteobacteria bacterium]
MQQYLEFVGRNWTLFLALALVSFFLARSQKGGANNLNAQQAVEKMSHHDAIVVDVREANEVASGMIRDSIHIPLAQLKDRFNELEKYTNKPIIMACRSGNRSAHAINILRKNGFTDLYNLKGGVMAWQHASLPLKRKKA